MLVFFSMFVADQAAADSCMNAVQNEKTSGICISSAVESFIAPASAASSAPVTMKLSWFVINTSILMGSYNLNVLASVEGSTTPNLQQATLFVYPQGTGALSLKGSASVTVPYVPGGNGPPYQFQVQSCQIGSGGQCGPWAVANYSPSAQNCAPSSGFICQPTPASPPNNTQSNRPTNFLPPPSGKAAPTGVLTNLNPIPPGGKSGQNAPLVPLRQATPTTAAVACKRGLVWRQATHDDFVCVDPGARQEVVADNNAAPGRHQPGSDKCLPGYVWRAATPQDHICVTPQVRMQTATENGRAN